LRWPDVANCDAPAGITALQAVTVGVDGQDDIDARAGFQLGRPGGETPGFGELASVAGIEPKPYVLAFASEDLRRLA
jgi:hypothetical protein